MLLAAALALWALASTALAADRRDIVFDCPCSAEWVAGDEGEPGTLTLHAGLRSLRASESGPVSLYVSKGWLRTPGLAERGHSVGPWVIQGVVEPASSTVIEVSLHEQAGRDAAGRSRNQFHEHLALWPVPGEESSPTKRFVDILTDADGDGVGDINERLAGAAPDDPASTPGESEIDLLALYTDDFIDLEAGYPYTLLLHAMNVTRAVFEDSGTNIQLRTVGMTEVELGGDDWVEGELRQQLMDRHGADLTALFGPSGGCSEFAGGCARGGPWYSSHWSDARVWANLHVGTILVVAHELGHAMGLAHSARQGETDRAWRWSRGHHVTPRGEMPRYGTIMAHGRYVLGGVFADPLADCGGVPCGVPAGEIDGADAVTSLDRIRFQVAAHRAPADDADGDGIVDAADALPDDPRDWFDVDGDGIGDNADPDDDNDGTDDVGDAFPLDPGEWADVDLDGIGDNTDKDVADLDPFRDPALRAAVESALGKAAGAAITAEEMASLTELNAWRRDIRDLTGLELATGLETLIIGDNLIDDLTPLSGLSELQGLHLGYNRITNLAPLSDLSALYWLNLSGNPVSDISILAGLDALRHLYLNDTQAAYADIVALPYFDSLRSLGVSGLGVEDISALGDSLDWQLDLARNPIADLSPVYGLTALRHLDLSEVGAPNWEWLEPFVKLRSLRLSGNRIADIAPLADMAEMERLALDGNRIADIAPLSGMTDLSSLALNDNRIDDLAPLAGMTHMDWLRLDRNRIADIAPLSGMTELRSLDLHDNRVDDLAPLAGMADMDWLRLDRNRIADLSPLPGMTDLRSLYLADNHVNDVSPLATMRRIRYLRLARNAVEDIAPLVNRTIWGGPASAGAWLDLDRNPLNDASVEEHIETLSSWGVDVRFWRRESPVPAPAVADPTMRAILAEALADAKSKVLVDDDRILWDLGAYLRRLRIQGRGVTSLAGLEAANGLESLYAASNGIADLSPLADLPELGSLDLRNNRIADIGPLAANADLGRGNWIALDGNPLSEESLNVHVPTLLEHGGGRQRRPRRTGARRRRRAAAL